MKDIKGNELGLKQSPKLEAKKSNKQKLEETLNFFKIAFCVDGEVKLSSRKDFEAEAVIELNDSKRGKFFVGVMKEKEK